MNNKVGPGSPPRESRFKKGTSGNPKGRPKAMQKASPSAFDIIIGKTLKVTRNGVDREVTVEEALQHRTYQDAIAGSRAARREVLKWIAKREEAIAERRKPAFNSGLKKTRFTHDPSNADEALLLLGIANLDPARQNGRQPRDHLLLEPWAVQTALGRRRGGQRLTKKEISEIKRCTREPDTLRWPRGYEE